MTREGSVLEITFPEICKLLEALIVEGRSQMHEIFENSLVSVSNTSEYPISGGEANVSLNSKVVIPISGIYNG